MVVENGPRPAHLTCLLSALMALVVVSVPLAAQQGRHLLAWEEPVLEGRFSAGLDDGVFHETAGIDLGYAATIDPTGVASAATTDYRYDDGHSNAYVWLESNGAPVYEQEFAQRFRLSGAGTVTYVEACFGRDDDRVGTSDLPVTVAFYRDSAGRPGRTLGSYRATLRNPDPGRSACRRVDHAGIKRQQLAGGNTWVSVQWQGSTGSGVVADEQSVGNTELSVRGRRSASSSWSSWQDFPFIPNFQPEVFFIRLGVDHEGSTPPQPDDDPEPPPTSGCTPTTTLLQFEGGYRVSMCYRTPDGDVGQAKSGIWASGQAGLLWFFDRGNAEVLVKVLDGCAHNGHRWVFVAPVTTLEFNLWVTGPNGRRWTHSNSQGVTALAKSDTSAFLCS